MTYPWHETTRAAYGTVNILWQCSQQTPYIVTHPWHWNMGHLWGLFWVCTQPMRDVTIAMFMGPTWGPSGADRTQVGLMLAPWTLLSGNVTSSLIGSAHAQNDSCMLCKFLGWFISYLQCHYDMVNIIPNPHKRHPIAHPSGQGLLWVQPVINFCPSCCSTIHNTKLFWIAF